MVVRVVVSRHPEEDENALDIGDATELAYDEQRHVTRVRVGGCRYRTLDASAGVRAYTRGARTKRFWHGYCCHKAIDHYTGAPRRPAHLVLGSQASQLPRAAGTDEEAIGDTPRAVVGDRGISVKAVFEHNTRRRPLPLWRTEAAYFALRRFLDQRRDKGLNRPYGPVADVLREQGLLPPDPDGLFGPAPPDDERPF